MKNVESTYKERITNLKNLLNNFERDKKISKNNGKKYLKKINKTNSFIEKIQIYSRWQIKNTTHKHHDKDVDICLLRMQISI